MSIGNFDTENISKQTSLAMWISFAVMAFLLIWCFVIPPRGENAEAILKGCALLYAIIPSAIVREAIKEGRGKDITFKHKDTEIQINDNDDE